MNNNIFTELAEINKAYSENIKEANLLGREDLAKLCDEYMQFLCDASRGLFKRAKAIEELAERFPECRAIIIEMKENMVQYGQKFLEGYNMFEQHQKEGTIPTNLPDISILLD